MGSAAKGLLQQAYTWQLECTDMLSVSAVTFTNNTEQNQRAACLCQPKVSAELCSAVRHEYKTRFEEFQSYSFHNVEHTHGSFAFFFLGGSLTLRLASGEPRANVQPTTARLLNLDIQDIPLGRWRRKRAQVTKVRPRRKRASELYHSSTCNHEISTLRDVTRRLSKTHAEAPPQLVIAIRAWLALPTASLHR